MCNENAYSKSYKESEKWTGRKTCVRTVNGSEQLSYWCSVIFLEYSSMLNATTVTNTF